MKNNNFKKILCTFIVAVLSIFMIPAVGAETCRIVARVKCEPNTLQYKNVSEFIGKRCLLKIYKFGSGREYEKIRASVRDAFLPKIWRRNYESDVFFMVLSYEDDDVAECFKRDFLMGLAADENRGDSFGMLDKFRYGCHLVGSAEFEGPTIKLDEYLDIDLNRFLSYFDTEDKR